MRVSLMRLSAPRVTLRRPPAAFARSVCTGGSNQQPWAVPFAVEETGARAAFSRWTKTAHARTTGIFALKSIRPEHVPFYVFEGQLRGSFTGVLEYKRREDYMDRDGKTRTRTLRDHYARPGIPLSGRPVGADCAVATAIYAGFDFRARFVDAALHGGISEAVLSRAVPVNMAHSPPFTGVGAFMMKPSFALAKAHERLRDEAAADATKALHSGAADQLEFRLVSGGGGLSGIFSGSIACPARDWQQPSSRQVEDLVFELKGARLHDHGVVLLPVWVAEYTYRWSNANSTPQCRPKPLARRANGMDSPHRASCLHSHAECVSPSHPFEPMRRR